MIWAVSDPDALPEVVREALTARDTGVGVSVISCAELACLQDRKRIAINEHWKTWFNRCIEINRWRVWDINLRVIQEAYSLPDSFHPDPADRVLVATARLHDLTLVTADARIRNYPHVLSLW
jgi:PIN domain nuclease of toxin-antitoxin system